MNNPEARSILSTGVEIPDEGVPTWDGRTTAPKSAPPPR